jgi:hypothetical protein
MIVDEALADEIRKADIKAVGLSAMEPTPGGGPTTISADLQ